MRRALGTVQYLSREPLAQRLDAGRDLGAFGFGQLESGRESDRARDILRAAAPSALLATAVQQRFQRDATAHGEHARALRCPELVPGERDRIDAEGGGIQRQPARRLDGVDVHGHAARPRHGGDRR